MRPSMMGYQQETYFNILRTVRQQEASIQQGATRIWNLGWLWAVQPDTWTELDKLVHDEERYKSPETSIVGSMCSTQRLLEVMDSPESNNAMWQYVRMPTNPPPGDPKGEMLLKLCEGEDATLAPISPKTDYQLPHWDGHVCMLEFE